MDCCIFIKTGVVLGIITEHGVGSGDLAQWHQRLLTRYEQLACLTR